MRNVTLPVTELGVIALTRGMLGAGAALLLGQTLPGPRRRWVAMTLLAIGMLSTVPLLIDLARRLRAESLDSAPPGTMI